MRRCVDILFDNFSGFQQITASKFLHKVKAAPIPGPIKVFPRGSCRLRAMLTLTLPASIASFHQQPDSSLLLDHHRRGIAPSDLSLQVLLLLACVLSSLRCWTGLRLFSPLCLCERNRTGSRLTLPCCLCTTEAGVLQMSPGTSSALFKAGGRLGGRASPCFKLSHINTPPTHTHACISVMSDHSWLVFQSQEGLRDLLDRRSLESRRWNAASCLWTCWSQPLLTASLS